MSWKTKLLTKKVVNDKMSVTRKVVNPTRK